MITCDALIAEQYPDAEIHLADNDAQMPDSHMERALRYFRANCVASWKGRAQD